MKAQGDLEEKADCKTSSINESREFQLTDPWRVELIKKHRYILSRKDITNEIASELAELTEQLVLEEIPEPIEESKLKGLKPILLLGMDYSQDEIYTGRVVELRSIEPVVVVGRCIFLVVEDQDGDTQRCIIYHYQHDDDKAKLEKTLGIGCNFSVANPHMSLLTSASGETSKPFIKVENPEMIILHPKKRMENMCRFCGTGNALKHCSKCKKANYCDRECQEKDWKIYKHKHICT